jgi:carnosine N-methyltransferase
MHIHYPHVNYCTTQGRLQEGVNRMPTRFVERLEPFYLDKLGRMQQCIDRNQPFLDAISGVGLWINADLARQQYDPKQDRLGVSSMNMDKVEVVLKQFCRDWCVDGQAERDMCYKPVFDYVTQHFSSQQQHSHATRILCPGCGLARLPWEFSREGYYAEGNEYTHFMILATLYTLSYDLKKRGTTQIYPWAANSSNHLSIDSQCAPISIPDVDPSEHKVMIQAGNFNEIYRYAAKYNVCKMYLYFLLYCVLWCVFTYYTPPPPQTHTHLYLSLSTHH